MADETGRRDASGRPATPLWVKVIGIALLVALILAALVFVVGGGRHGPGMHGSAESAFRPLAITTSQVSPSASDHG
jgi:hypothetical protein